MPHWLDPRTILSLLVAVGSVAGAVALGGCPSRDEVDADAVVTEDVDTSGGDGATVGFDTTSGGDATSDDDATDGRDGTASPGGFGTPCTRNEQCDSGYCIDGYAGRVCSSRCDGGAECAQGWTCTQDVAAFPDVVFVCSPSFPTLCRPCDSNAECRGPGAESLDHRCIDGGDEGSFCGGACLAAACPPGYTCAASTDTGGGLSQQCVPVDGMCECSPNAIAEGASTTCGSANDLGRCEGLRVCAIGGLTACDAPTPAVDVCNGADDDCDGALDEDHEAVACAIENAAGVCAGTSRCEEGVARCDARTPAADVCGDAIDNDCDGVTDGEDGVGCELRWADEDNDTAGTGDPRCLCKVEGVYKARVGGDCDDDRADVSPYVGEICDGIDNDCNGQTDEAGALGCSTFYRDADVDGYGDPNDARCLCGPDAVNGYVSKTPTDCDDTLNGVHPGVAELCDMIDNDCDGQTDEAGAGGCALHFADGDADTWGNSAIFACLCRPSAEYPVARSGDCDDQDDTRYPERAELCDLVDNDCDGQTDEENASDCTVYHRDSDSDGFGSTSDTRCLCAPESPWVVERGGDCNDAASAINPDAPETCNGKDDDCDSVTDGEGSTGCTLRYRDGDRDSYGLTDDAKCLCNATGVYSAPAPGDCDDANPFTHPNALEVCNGVDDNCVDGVDENIETGCTPYYYDGDGDGWGVDGDSRCLCGPDGLYRAVRAGDCADEDPAIHPFAEELCDSVDNDCEGGTDEEGATDCTIYYADADEDEWGTLGDVRCLCAPSEPHSALQGGDCDETDPDVNPGAAEACNTIDDDCDGAVDPLGSVGCVAYLRDADQDDYGVAGEERCLCAPSAPFSALAPGDCNDADPAVNPGAPEICNGKDDDCSFVADDPGTQGCYVFYRDEDSDTWGDETDSQCLCAPSGPYKATSPGDCDDARAEANPAVSEVCNDLDDNCDGDTDEAGAVGCMIRLRDGDNDTWGVSGDLMCLCEASGEYLATQGGDCDDGAFLVNPGAAEACGGGDDDCDGQTDEEGATGCMTWLRDLDGDGYGVTAQARCLCAASDPYDTQVGGDCNDSTTLISPASDEFCNQTDDDCDGATDEPDAVGCQALYLDVDDDGFGVGESQCLCGPQGQIRAGDAGDCADDDALRNPARPERCDALGEDEDCDDEVNEANAIGCTNYFRDADGDSFGVTLSRTCLCGPTGQFTATAGGDCNDSSGSQAPNKTETCNAIDDDCDGLVDEGCGLQVGGWPTAKADARRSGSSKTFVGPVSPTMRWKRALKTGADKQLVASPVIDTAGNVFMVVADKLHKLRPSNGTDIWAPKTLPAAMSLHASPTLRRGGTIVIPVGNGIALYNLDGAQLWHRAFPGTNNPVDEITGSPMVDEQGNIYAVGYSFAYKLDAGGNVLWAIALPNAQYTAAHVAISPTTGRLHFGASNHALFAIEPSGLVAWTFIVNSDVDASSVISESGVIYQTFGSAAYRVVDNGNQPSVGISGDAGSDLDAHMSLWRDAAGVDHLISNANSSSGVRSFNGTTMVREWTFTSRKNAGRNSTPTIDKNGVIFVGDGDGSGNPPHFYAINGTNGQQIWVFGQAQGLDGGGDVDSESALASGAIFFGDDAGYLYCVANP